MASIFIKRSGLATMQVRVFKRRPWQLKAARGMRRKGIAEHVICYSLGINRARLSRSFGPAAFFKL